MNGNHKSFGDKLRNLLYTITAGLNFVRVLLAVLLLCLLIAVPITVFRSCNKADNNDDPKKATHDMVVSDVKKIGRLVTASYYEEIVIDSTYKKVGESILGGVTAPFTRDTIYNEGKYVLIVKSEVKVGFDLSKMKEGDFKIDTVNNAKTLKVQLPPPEMWQYSKQQDVDVFEETGSWSWNDRNVMKARAERRIIANAQKGGIIDKAEKNAKQGLEPLFKSFGFDDVKIEFKQQSNGIEIHRDKN